MGDDEKPKLPFDPLTATDEQIRLWRMRENLARYGTTYAPDDAPEAAPVKRRSGKRAVAAKWFEVSKVCPRCEKTKNVGRDFGTIIRRGIESPNSWCNDCRSETSNSYRRKPPTKRE